MKNKRKPIAIISIIIYILIGIGVLFELITGKTDIKFKHYPISHEDIPESFDGFKIIQLSDIHYGKYLKPEYLKNIVKKVNEEKPDIVVLTGDMIDIDEDYIEECYEILSEIQADTYAVLGNHEGWVRRKPSIKAMEKYGITLLRNQSITLTSSEDSIVLSGLNDMTSDTPDSELALESAKKEDYVIVLSHNPNMFDQVDLDLVDLMFSGHNHGGQITFFGLFAPYLPGRVSNPDYRTGHVSKENSDIIISNGIGTTALPVRFFADPQVVIVTLNSSKKDQ